VESPSTTLLPAEPFRRSPKLDAVFIADAARERTRAVRDLLIALLAVLGLPLWLLLVAAWPGHWVSAVRSLAATSWAVVALGLLVALVRERWWSRVRSRRVEALGPLPRLRSERLGRAACATPADEED
jgi:hypothetical protein